MIQQLPLAVNSTLVRQFFRRPDGANTHFEIRGVVRFNVRSKCKWDSTQFSGIMYKTRDKSSSLGLL